VTLGGSTEHFTTNDQDCQFGFFEARFGILAFLNAFGIFWKSKKARQNLAFSGFFSVGKTWLWKDIVRAAYSLQISSEKGI